MIHAAICDDYPAQLKILTALLEKYIEERPGVVMQFSCFSSGVELLKSMAAGNEYNLLLLDIIMPEINGIELARKIREYNEDAVMIYLTVSKDHALEAYGVSAVQYILKPIKMHTLFPVLDSVIPTLKQEKERYFMLSTTESDIRIPFSSIICVELNHRRLKIYLDNGKTVFSKYIRTTFPDTVAPLLLDERFIRPHKSFVINLDKAKELTKNVFILKNDIIAPVSRLKYAEMRNAYLSYIGNEVV